MDWSIEDIKRMINCLNKLLTNCCDERKPNHNIINIADNDMFWYTVQKSALEEVLRKLTEEIE